jgi:TonB family protein
MRLIIAFVLLFLATEFTMAQNVSYEYFTRNWQETTQQRAYYVREIKQLDSDLYFVTDSATNRSRIKKGYYKSLNSMVEHGHFTFIFNDRNEIYTGNYNNGEMVGEWIISNLHGNGWESINYDFELPIVEVEIVERITFGGPEQMATFEGGDVGLLRYLQSSIRYPPRVLFYDIQGRVFCQFLIDTTGQVVNIRILRSVDKDLDKETIRAVAGLPSSSWAPAECGGQKIQIWYQIPVTFSLRMRPNNNRRLRF